MPNSSFSLILSNILDHIRNSAVLKELMPHPLLICRRSAHDKKSKTHIKIEKRLINDRQLLNGLPNGQMTSEVTVGDPFQHFIANR